MSRTPTRRLLGTVGAGAAVAGTVAVARTVRRVQTVREERAAARAALPSDHDLTYDSVTLRSVVDTELHAWWVPAAAERRPAVLVVHGAASHAGDLLPVAPLLHEAGFHVLLLDLRGHGRSERHHERARPPELANDVRVAVDWLAAHGEVGPIGVVGHSLGGSTAIIAASRDERLAAVVSVAAPADPTLARIAWWPATLSRAFVWQAARESGADPTTHFARTRITEVDAPVLLIHGGRDGVVPVAHGHALAAARPDAELLVLPEATHGSFDAFSPALDRAVTFLGTHLHGDA